MSFFFKGVKNNKEKKQKNKNIFKQWKQIWGNKENIIFRKQNLDRCKKENCGCDKNVSFSILWPGVLHTHTAAASAPQPLYMHQGSYCSSEQVQKVKNYQGLDRRLSS